MTIAEILLDWLGKNYYYIGNDLLEKVEELKKVEKQQIIDAYKIAMEKNTTTKHLIKNNMYKNLLLDFNNRKTNKITINEVDNDTNLAFTLLDLQEFSKILIDKLLESYNDYLNFEYSILKLDNQDIEEFKNKQYLN